MFTQFSRCFSCNPIAIRIQFKPYFSFSCWNTVGESLVTRISIGERNATFPFIVAKVYVLYVNYSYSCSGHRDGWDVGWRCGNDLVIYFALTFTCPICLGCVTSGEVGRGYRGPGGQPQWLLQQLRIKNIKPAVDDHLLASLCSSYHHLWILLAACSPPLLGKDLYEKPHLCFCPWSVGRRF